jgi:hypothetical protein
MTIESILQCEIPKDSVYYITLRLLWSLVHDNWLYDKQHNTNLYEKELAFNCAAFTALYEIAQGQTVEKFTDSIIYDSGWREGKQQVFREVLDVVDELNTSEGEKSPNDRIGDGSRLTCKELKRRIQKLAEGEK